MKILCDKNTEEILTDCGRHLGIEQKADVMKRAVTLLKVCVEAQRAGGAIVIINGNEQTEIVLNEPAVPAA